MNTSDNKDDSMPVQLSDFTGGGNRNVTATAARSAASKAISEADHDAAEAGQSAAQALRFATCQVNQ
jgi:hypothetical protein